MSYLLAKFYKNRALSDSSLFNLLMHSVIVGAREMTRILLHFSASGDKDMELLQLIHQLKIWKFFQLQGQKVLDG